MFLITCVITIFSSCVHCNCIPCDCNDNIMECNDIYIYSFHSFCDDFSYSERAIITQVYAQNSHFHTINDVLICLPSVFMLDLSGARCDIQPKSFTIDIIGHCEVSTYL